MPATVSASQVQACLETVYGLRIVEISRLLLGADPDTTVYRVVADDTTPYFLKLRSGAFPEATVRVPYWLAQAGMPNLIPPIATRTGALWTPLDTLTVILYPFLEGRSGWDAELSQEQWVDLGTSLRALHRAAVPSELLRSVPRETYSPVWRDRVRAFLSQETYSFGDDPVATAFRGLLQAKKDLLLHIVVRAEALALQLVRQSPVPCLCHGDIHAGNVLLTPEGRLYVVDWDTLVLAPKERDLMFVGGGVGGIWNRDHEVEWFYEGYGPTTLSGTARAYYRLERIVRDVAEFCELILDEGKAPDERAALLDLFIPQFEPGNVVEIALSTDRSVDRRDDMICP